MGDRLAPVALAFAVLNDLDGTPAELGGVVAAGTMPFAVFALLAGVWGDRLPRQKVMLASDLVRFGVQLAAGLLLLTGNASIWKLAGLAAIYGTADAFFQPALSGLMPQIVSSPRLQQANALRGLTQSTGLVLGPALAGVLVAVAGPGEAILVDSATVRRERGLPRPATPGRRRARAGRSRFHRLPARAARGLGGGALQDVGLVWCCSP